MPRLHLRISGRVQGVGFRAATLRAASQQGLTGWVRNLPDGCVEAEFEGAPPALHAIREWCGHGPRFASVQEVIMLPETGEPHYSAFEIR
jgi:acylphosphatase